MTLLLQLAAFVLGAYLSIRVIAALHGAVDLWYDIRATYPRVIGAIVVWEAMVLASLWLLELPYQSAFLWGFAVYLLFYLSLLPLVGLYVGRMRHTRTLRNE
ncbi:MAG: hypothetical protein HY017_19370 [Betaproteobacteria bacterium]|nr:hypothetical protein [Betaproteobacteria bacterium]